MVGIPSRRAVEKVKSNNPKWRMSLGQMLQAWAIPTDASHAHRVACANLIGNHRIVPGVPLFTADDVTNWGLVRRNRTSYTSLRRLHCGYDSDHDRLRSATCGLPDKGNELRMKDEHWLATTALYHVQRFRARPIAIIVQGF